MHVYVWEHIAFPTEQIDGQILEEVDPGQHKNRSMRSLFSKRIVLQNATATNRMQPRILN